MRKTDLVRQLYAAAGQLRSLAQSVSPNAAVWDGTQYVKQGPQVADPCALAWFVKLTTMAALIEAQESPLSARQITHLKSELFGGMGGLMDVWFDPKATGDVGRGVNERLGKETDALFAILSEDL